MTTLRLRRVLLAAAIVLPVAVTIAAQFSSHPRGPLFIPLYVAPLLAAAPIWLRVRLAERPLALSAVWILDVLVLILGAMRALGTGWIPFSGHTLFLAYSALVTRHRGYRILALVLFVETTVFKLWVWHDPFTWALGTGVGLVLAVLASRLDREPVAH